MSKKVFNLRTYRLCHQFTQGELSGKLGICVKTLQRYEKAGEVPHSLFMLLTGQAVGNA